MGRLGGGVYSRSPEEWTPETRWNPLCDRGSAGRHRSGLQAPRTPQRKGTLTLRRCLRGQRPRGRRILAPPSRAFPLYHPRGRGCKEHQIRDQTLVSSGFTSYGSAAFDGDHYALAFWSEIVDHLGGEPPAREYPLGDGASEVARILKVWLLERGARLFLSDASL